MTLSQLATIICVCGVASAEVDPHTQIMVSGWESGVFCIYCTNALNGHPEQLAPLHQQIMGIESLASKLGLRPQGCGGSKNKTNQTY